MLRPLLVFLAAFPAALLAQGEYTWSNPRLEARGVPGDQFQAIGKIDLAGCEAQGAREARQVIPVSNPPPGFSDDGWRGTARDRRRTEIAKVRTDACMAEKGWVVRKR